MIFIFSDVAVVILIKTDGQQLGTTCLHLNGDDFGVKIISDCWTILGDKLLATHKNVYIKNIFFLLYFIVTTPPFYLIHMHCCCHGQLNFNLNSMTYLTLTVFQQGWSVRLGAVVEISSSLP